QPPVLLQHVGGRPIGPLAAVGLVLADPVPQGFRVDVQLLSQPADHRLRVGLPVQAHRPFTQLVGVLLGGSHDDFLPRFTRSNLVWKSPANRGRLRRMDCYFGRFTPPATTGGSSVTSRTEPTCRSSPGRRLSDT